MAAKVELTLKIPALEQLLNLTASGIGSVAGPMLAPWQAQKFGKAKQIAAEADATVLRIQAAAQSQAREALVPSGVQATGALDIGNRDRTADSISRREAPSQYHVCGCEGRRSTRR